MLSMGLPLISFGTPELEKLILENQNGIIIYGCDQSLEDSIISASNIENNQKIQFSINSIELSKKIFSSSIAHQFLEDL